MSLNKLTSIDRGLDAQLKIGCLDMVCQNLVCENMVMPPNSDAVFHDILVENRAEFQGETKIGETDFQSVNSPVAGYVLRSTGTGTEWTQDQVGTPGINYSGVPPTIPGQMVIFDDVLGLTAKQSAIRDTGADLDLDGKNISNVNLVAGESIPQLRTDITNNSLAITSLEQNQITFTGTAPANSQIAVFDTLDGSTLKNDGLVVTPAELQLGSRSIQCNNGNFAGSIDVDVVGPRTGNQVRIGDVVIEDQKISCDEIVERTPFSGVTVEGVLLKDSAIEAEGLTVKKSGTDNILVEVGDSNNLESQIQLRGNNLARIEILGFSSELSIAHDQDDQFRLLNDGNNVLQIKQENQDRIALKNTGIVFEGDTSGYTFPTTRGTNGQILVTNGTGDISWITPQFPPIETMQETYDNSTSPQIQTTVANPNFVIKDSGEFQVGPVFDLQDSSNNRLFAVDAVAGVNIKDQYSLPNVSATQPGQVLTDILGDGTTSWENAPVPTLQETYDNSLSPQIITTITNDTMVVRQGLGVPTNILEVQDSSGNPVMEVKDDKATFGPVEITDGNSLKLNSTSSLAQQNPVEILMQSAGVFSDGLLLKVINIAGQGRLAPIASGDADSIPVVGTSLDASLAPNQDVRVAIGGTFFCTVQAGATVSAGNLCEKSDVPGQDGRILATAASVGSSMIALTSGTGNVAGTVKVLCLKKHSESF